MTEPKIGALVRTSLVDFPGRVCATLFLKHCNLHCPYCYNGPLVNDTEDEENLVTLSEVKNHLLKRKNVLSGFVISGGEALLSPLLPELIIFAKQEGYKVKLDTNGTLPEKLEKLIENEKTRPDFIAIDLKTIPSDYKKLTENQNMQIDFNFLLNKSISIISKYDPNDREFRTVLVPELTDSIKIKQMAGMLPKDACWRFAQFINENCLKESWNSITPYSDKEIAKIIEEARKIVKNSELR